MSKKTKKETAKKITFTNAMIYGVLNNFCFLRIKRSLSLPGTERHKINHLFRTISESIEAKALQDSMDAAVKRHEKENEKIPKEKRRELTIFHPYIQEIFEIETGLKVAQLIVDSKGDFPEGVSIEDGEQARWLIDII